MIGYFSLNVPSGLTLYWFANNLITTAQQVRPTHGASLRTSRPTPLAWRTPRLSARGRTASQRSRGPLVALATRRLTPTPSPFLSCAPAPPQMYLRNKFGAATAAAGAGGGAVNASTAVIDVEPEEKKPSGGVCPLCY